MEGNYPTADIPPISETRTARTRFAACGPWGRREVGRRGRAGLRRRWDGRSLKRVLQHLVDRHREVEAHRLAHFLRHIIEIAAVALGQDHRGQSRGVSCEHLLLDPADGEHATLKRDLSGHAHGVAYGP